MVHPRIATLAAVIAVMLAGAAHAGMGSKVLPGYTASAFALQAQRGLSTVVMGAETVGLDDDGVRALLRMPGWLSGGRFIAAPPQGAGARLVLLLNPADPVEAKRNVCGDVSALTYARRQDSFVLRAALCEGERMLSRVTATEGPLAGGALARLLGLTTTYLFPQATSDEIDPPGV